MQEIILSAILSLPMFKEDVGPGFAQEKRIQYETIAIAIDKAVASATGWPGSKAELAAFVLTAGYHETRFSLRVGSGDCRRWECDGGRAQGYWQLHVEALQATYRRSPAIFVRKLWVALPGLDAESTELSAREATSISVRARRMCESLAVQRGEDWVVLAFASFTGSGCLAHLRGKEDRARTFHKILSHIDGALKPAA